VLDAILGWVVPLYLLVLLIPVLAFIDRLFAPPAPPKRRLDASGMPIHTTQAQVDEWMAWMHARDAAADNWMKWALGIAVVGFHLWIISLI
jgi:hypothetical protein